MTGRHARRHGSTNRPGLGCFGVHEAHHHLLDAAGMFDRHRFDPQTRP